MAFRNSQKTRFSRRGVVYIVIRSFVSISLQNCALRGTLVERKFNELRLQYKRWCTLTSPLKQRKRLGLSLRQLGKLFGQSKAQLSLIERGKKPIPGWMKFAFAGLRMDLARHLARRQGQTAESDVSCPECGSPMRTYKSY